MTWAEPSNAGPPITGYGVQYRAGDSGSFTDWTHSGTGRSTTITGLLASTAYQVQVRATNDEGTGDWSNSGVAREAGDGDLRIVGGGTSGRLQIRHGDDWKGICNDKWDEPHQDNAGVACRQLDYRAGSAIESIAVPGDRDFLLDDVFCAGHEADFLACGHAGLNVHNCNANEHVGVSCSDAAPSAPRDLNAVAGDGQVALSWRAPTSPGDTAIVRYEFAANEDGGGYERWTAIPDDERWTAIPVSAPDEANAVGYTVGDVVNGKSYSFLVRAVNGSTPGTGGPSNEATATPTTTGSNNAPTFTDGASTTRGVAENTPARRNIGSAVSATDDDVGDTLTYTLGGTDGGSFDIVSTSGQLRTKTGVTYDYETTPSYAVTVTVSDGTDTDSIAVTINVTDVNEPPPPPAAPTLTGSTVSSLTVGWTAPAITGRPAIDGYDVRWRVKTPPGSWTELSDTTDSTDTTATITGLGAATTYEVQVRAINDEGAGGWSASGDGTTSAPPPSAAPAITSVAIANDPASGQAGYFKSGDEVYVAVTWDAAVTVDGTDGTPSVRLLVGSLASLATDARYVSGSGTAALTFRYRVVAGHRDDDGLSVPAGSVVLNGATIVKRDATVNAGLVHAGVATDAARKVDGVAPTANAVGIPNNPYRNTHAPDSPTADINWVVIFSEAVMVRERRPYLEFILGTDTRRAEYSGGRIFLTQDLQFVYRVVDGDFDADGVGHADNPVRLNGGSIRDKAGNDAVFDIAATLRLEGHKVDGVKPVLRTAEVTGTTLVLTYDEDLDTGSLPSAGAFTVALGTGTAPTVSEVAVSRRAVTLTLSRAVLSTDVVTLSYTAPTGTGATPIRDAFGNVADNFTSEAVTNATTNAAPTFTEGEEATRSVAENTAAGENVGDAVTAIDADAGDTLTYGLEGSDAASFAIDASTGQIKTNAALNHETKASYAVTVKATDVAGATATIAVTIDVTDDDTEAPGAPAAPTFGTVTEDSLVVNWREPANAGPAITDYDVRYQTMSPPGSWAELPDTTDSTATTATITSLTESTLHEVQVRAQNAEGTGDWSPSGEGTTSAAPAPAITSVTFANDPASGQAGYFKSGDDVDVAVTWDAAVTVDGTDGTPSVRLLVGSLASAATDARHVSGSGTATLTFRYRVAAGHRDDDGLSVPMGSVALNGGTIVKRGATVAAGLAHAGVATDAARKVDGAKPVLRTAEVTGTTLVLTYDEDLDTGSSPSAGAFTVALGTGTAPTVSEVAVSRRAVTLTLSRAVLSTDVVTLSYTAPTGTGATPIRDAVGNVADNLANVAMANATINVAPTFPSAPATREVAENTAAGENVGDAVTAIDADAGDTLTYGLEGSDAASFAIDASTGQIKTNAALNHETKASYAVTVKATDVAGATATIAVTIDVTDDDTEAPGAPAAPTFGTVTEDSLVVNWREPANAGPAITDYDVRYQTMSPPGSWAELPDTTDSTATTATITSLTESTLHEVQVRAQNAEGTGDWSPSGEGTTSAAPAPAITSVTFANDPASGQAGYFKSGDDVDVAVTWDAAVTVDGTDGTPSVRLLVGSLASAATDARHVSGSGTATLTFRYRVAAGHRDDDGLSVPMGSVALNGGTIVKRGATVAAGLAHAGVATDAARKVDGAKPVLRTAEVTGTTLVLTYDEDLDTGSSPSAGAFTVALGTGTAPTVSEVAVSRRAVTLTLSRAVLSTDVVTLSYTAPTGTGATPIRDAVGNVADNLANVAMANATINVAPTFPSAPATREVAENTAAGENVGDAVTAIDADAGDTLTYGLEGSDAASFAIDASTGQIKTNAALNHETKASYAVTVKATDVAGATATIAVTIDVTDDDTEAPGAPAAPTFGIVTEDSLVVNWREPANAGPAITDYDVRYQTMSPPGSWAELPDTTDSTATTATITSLTESTLHEVQVRAQNAEGTGDWSPSGEGTTSAAPAPAITSVTFANDPASGQAGYFKSGDDVDVAVTWDAAVTVDGTDGTPSVRLLVGSLASAATDARHVSGSGTATLTFRYRVAAGHRDDDGLSVPMGSVALNGGTIVKRGATVAAGLAHAGVATDAARKVDGAKPVLRTAEVTGTTLVLTYDEDLDTGSSPSAGAFTVALGTGTAPTVSEVAVSRRAVTLTLSRAVLSTDVVTLSYTAPTGTGATPIRDAVGNVADNLANVAMANATINVAPTFPSGPATREVAENTAAGENVGDAVTAIDADAGDTLTYGLEGSDAASFAIDASTGQIKTNAALNHETKASYAVTVKATDVAGATATIAVTIDVTDDDTEAPGAPAAPTFGIVTEDSLVVNWREPANAGPAITDYDVRYQTMSPPGSWAELPDTTDSTATTATITSLTESTLHEVQVRAQNAEGTGDWSPSGEGTTSAAPNAAPTFTSLNTASVAENTTTVLTVVATDDDTDDSVTGYALQGGADQSKFSIVEASGVLTFITAPNFENANNTYVVIVRATSGTGSREMTADQTITVTVTDDDTEAPGAPATPSVSAGSDTGSLDVTWTEPSNAGPPITGYGVQYRAGDTGSFTEWAHSGTGRSATITGLLASTEYQVRVRAISDEGTGAWSDSGAGTTGVTQGPGDGDLRIVGGGTSGRLQIRYGGDWKGICNDRWDGPNQDNAGVACRQLGYRAGTVTPSIRVAGDTDFLLDDLDCVGHEADLLACAHAGVNTHNCTAGEHVGVSCSDAAPSAPRDLNAVAGDGQVALSWRAPTSAGDTAIVRYEYATNEDGGVYEPWTAIPSSAPSEANAVSYTVDGIVNDKSYGFLVRAVNGSTPGTGGPSNEAAATPVGVNNPPTFTDGDTTTRSIAENTASGRNIGPAVAADDDDGGDTLTYTLGGMDAASFDIVATSGQLRTSAPLDFESKSSYTVTVTVSDGTDTDTIAVTIYVTDVAETQPPSGGGGGGGGSSNRPPLVEAEIPDQALDAGAVLELDVRLNFYDRERRALTWSAESDDPAVVAVEVDDDGEMTVRALKPGLANVTVTVADHRDETVSDTFTVIVHGPSDVWLFPTASDPLGRQGFARIVNHGDVDGTVAIVAIDDTGRPGSAVTLAIGAGRTVHFNSDDLETGNDGKGLTGSAGTPTGDWRLAFDTDLDFEALSYIRTSEGFVTAMHDLAPETDGTHRVAIFNPGSNTDQVSLLRLVNPGDEAAAVTVRGTDDAGEASADEVTVSVAAHAALTLTAQQLESGEGVAGLRGALGDGAGKWRLSVVSEQPIRVLSLLSSPPGHLTNLSSAPVNVADGVYTVPLFPAASDPNGRQGFVRVINRSERRGEVTVTAHDDSEWTYEPLTLAIGAGEAAQFNSDDLELGNADKGLTGSTGAGTGAWRLELSSERDIDVLAYIRTTEGFLTSMHDLAPVSGDRHRAAIFNPGSNTAQVSLLRLVNDGDTRARVTISGLDDAGTASGTVRASVAAGAVLTLTAQALEAGGEGLTGSLGDGVGKWRLLVVSDRPITAMSLLSSPTGHLTNLSTAPMRGARGSVPAGQ